MPASGLQPAERAAGLDRRRRANSRRERAELQHGQLLPQLARDPGRDLAEWRHWLHGAGWRWVREYCSEQELRRQVRTSLSFFFLPTFIDNVAYCVKRSLAKTDSGQTEEGTLNVKIELCHISWTTVLPMTAHALMKIEGDLSVARYWPAITRYTDNLIARARCVKRSHLN